MTKKAVIVGYMRFRRWVRGESESGIGMLTRFPLTPDFPVRIAGQVGASVRINYSIFVN